MLSIVLQQNGYRGNEELRQWDGEDNILNLLLIDSHFSFQEVFYLASLSPIFSFGCLYRRVFVSVLWLKCTVYATMASF